jgi:hypothetical protein
MLLKLRPVDGLFINSYPYISADGFDWIYEGLALWELVVNGDKTPWVSLRNPVFVLVTAIDHGLRANGMFIIVIQSLAFAATLYALVRIGRLYNISTKVIASCMFGYTFMPLSYFNLFVLADPLCLGLMTVSVERLLSYQADPRPTRRSSLWTAGALAAAAALTQPYGFIPFNVIAGLDAARDFFRRRMRWDLAATIILTIAAWFILRTGWGHFILPNIARIPQMHWVKINFDMMPFYFQTWTIILGPFVPALVYGAVRSHAADPAGVARFELAAVIVVFMALVSVYQFYESRFTWFFMPILFALVLILVPSADRVAADVNDRRLARIVSGTFFGVGLFGLLLTPGEYWTPTFRAVALAPPRTWFGDSFRIKTVDRYELESRCGSMTNICPSAVTPHPDDYVFVVLDAYRLRHLSLNPERHISEPPAAVQ